MYNNTTLGNVIDWLEKQNPELIVKDGFGSPHSDRGSYEELAFDSLGEAKIGDMLKHAKSAVGAIFEGWKGGNFKMDLHTSVYIGDYGECGTPITPIHFKYWLLTAGRDSPEGTTMDNNEDICGFCGKPGADKIPHPVRWPNENSAGTEYVHSDCENAECKRAHSLLSDKERESFLRTV